MSDSPKWITAHHVQRLHDRTIEIVGGAAGTRDAGLLASAVARPQNAHAYGEEDLFKLAATYAHGIASNHPFVDGNKRTGFLAADLFLSCNGYSLNSEPAALHTEMMVGLAEGQTELDTFAQYLKEHSQQVNLERLGDTDRSTRMLRDKYHDRDNDRDREL